MKIIKPRIGLRLGVGFGIVLFLLIIGTYVGIYGLQVMKVNLDHIYNNNMVKNRLTTEMMESVDGIKEEMLTILLTKDDAAKSDSYKRIQSHRSKYQAATDELRRDEPNQTEEDLLAKTEQLLAITKSINNQVIALALQKNNDEAIRLYKSSALPSFEKTHNSLNELIEYEENNSKFSYQEATKAANQTKLIMFILGCIAILIGSLISFFITKGITRPLRAAVSVAEEIGARNLNVHVPTVKFDDEVGLLMQAFKVMANNLREEITEISEGVNILSAVTTEISLSTAQLATTSTQSAEAVGEATATMEELMQTTQLSSQKAQHVTEITYKAVEISQLGQTALTKTVEGMERIKEQMGSIAESIISLSQHSQAIGEIVSTVDELAEHTNLLSVNASIEAAKAGEQGKGFSVVAQEIRNLADQSKLATRQIKTILNDIQKATSSAVMITEQGSKVVEESVTQTSETGASIHKLDETIKEASNSVIQITASVQQQTMGVEQITTALININEASHESVGGSKQLDSSVKNMEVLATKLKDMVEKYKI